jgi:hypothetical protein
LQCVSECLMEINDHDERLLLSADLIDRHRNRALCA